MLRLAVIVTALAACGSAPPASPAAPSEAPRSTFAEEDVAPPSYGKPELTRALIAERGFEASAERRVAELEAKTADSDDPATADQLRVALADLAVRRRFIATLERCEATGALCPPRLDEPPWPYDPDPDKPAPPPMSAPLRYDLESWRALTAELHGRACACRTLACVDSVGVAIDHLETRPMPVVLEDDAATLATTRARTCLFRLRGKVALPPVIPET